MAMNKKPMGVNFEKILHSLQGDVENMRSEFNEIGCPVNDDSTHLHQFCERLEFFLTSGLRERGGLLGGRRDLWHYVCRCLADRRNIHDGLRVVKANTELKTGVGRVRCLVRYCLVHGCLGDVVQQCVENRGVTRQCYQDGAPLLHPTYAPALYSSLYNLSDLKFDLPPSGYDLDMAWPAFTRGGIGSWRPPSRTMSVSSLFSQVSEAPSLQSPINTNMMGPLGEMDDPIASPDGPSTGVEDVETLHTRLVQLEEENTSLRTSCTHLQQKLDEALESSSSAAAAPNETVKHDVSECSRCETLSEELTTSREECHELRRLQQMLEGQVEALQTQVDECHAQEDKLKDEIKALTEAAADNRLIKTDTQGLSYSPPTLTINEPEETIPIATLQDQKQTQHSSEESSQDMLDQCRRKLEEVEKENTALKEQFKAAEIEKTTLRTNIRKVSANWFERKTRLSDSESESSGSETNLSRENSCSRKEEGVQVPDMEVLEKYGSLFKKVENMPQLLAEISFVTGKIDLTERMCCELRKRVKDYENVIDDQEDIIHGLKDQLDTYFNDNQKMSQQLSNLTKLFEDLELTEKTRVNAANPPDSSSSSFPTLPSEEDFKQMSSSLSMTYIKLKELIMEKKSLVTEIERLNVLNVELQRRVTQQETRLVSVSDALHTTWLLVSDMKEQHAQLHASESILRYELKGKRDLLHRLREELECSREQWHKIRQMNSQSEEAWNSLRDELDERRRIANETPGQDDKAEGGTEEEVEGAVAVVPPVSEEFEPPVDLLLDMAIEYGVIDADDETSTTMVAAMEGQDMRASRLQQLEDQCSYLYQKLMASTARSLTLASRLSALHHHFGSSDEEDDDDDDEDDEDEYDEEEYEEEYEEEQMEMDDDHLLLLESELLSPDAESSDTAYMSEADSGSAASGAAGNLSEEEAAEGQLSPSGEALDIDGDLSKRLINFLPKKIEILHRENKRLEERCELLHHEKLTVEAQLGQSLQMEKQQKKQLEEQLEHLGKCVDELKLERNGKIIEAEECLKQKVDSLSQREKEYETLQEEIEQLQEKYEERGTLLHVATDRVKELELAVQSQEHSSEDATTKLHQANDQVQELQSLHEELNSEYRQLKEEMIDLQQQLTDLKFQVSSKDMERHAAVQADQEKKEALTAAMCQISQYEEEISNLKQQLSSEKHKFVSQRDKLSNQVGELTQTLEEQESKCSNLDNQLQQTEMNLKVNQQSLSENQKELSSTKEESSQLTEDNEQLREKIIQLLREKDSLWQAKMRLEAAAGGGREWMEDKNASACLGCQAAFSITRRRHHCRACGRIFCTGCSDNWIMSSASSRRVRVCDDCFSVQAELAAIVASPTPTVQSTSTTQHTERGNETENLIIPSTSGPLPIANILPNDEDYAMISDEELQTSRMSSSPSSESPLSNNGDTTETRATLDIISFATLNTNPPTDAEVWVGAGTRVLVPVELPAGVSLHWKFVSEPKSVSFAVLHQPPVESCTQQEDGGAKGSHSESQQRVLIPTTRVASTQGSVIRGKLLAKQPGVYTLVFDNSCSRFTAKKVTYNLSLDTPTTPSPSTPQPSSVS